jgi:predicted house-cleaning noncanonical NTP pyrophosphatase (MazG superfamily)
MSADKYANGYPVKLVRDYIGERLGGDGTITYELVADRAEHVALLRRKLVEEAVEYLTSPTADELADVFEVVAALAIVDLRITLGELTALANRKTMERGSFEDGVVMVAHHEADGRDLLPKDAA